MNLRFLRLIIIGLVVIFLSTACASSSTPSAAGQQATNIAMGVALAGLEPLKRPRLLRQSLPHILLSLPLPLQRRGRSSRPPL